MSGVGLMGTTLPLSSLPPMLRSTQGAPEPERILKPVDVAGAVLAALAALAGLVPDLDEVGDDDLPAGVEHDAVVLAGRGRRLLGVGLERLGVVVGAADVALDLVVEGDRVVVVVEQLVDVGVGEAEEVDAEDGRRRRPRIQLDALEVGDELRIVGERILLARR